MTPDEILNRPARILSNASREHYFETGYLHVDGLVGDDWLSPLRDLTRKFVDESRRSEGRDARFDLEPEPKSWEAETSAISMRVSCLSSTYRLT